MEKETQDSEHQQDIDISSVLTNEPPPPPHTHTQTHTHTHTHTHTNTHTHTHTHTHKQTHTPHTNTERGAQKWTQYTAWASQTEFINHETFPSRTFFMMN